jgi:tRNA(Ile)-lysidine synthase TilS/MesJ
MKKCKICVLPGTYPGIQFNEEGVCNFCLNYKNQNILGVDELKKILSSRKGEKYDCVVPVSGGRDSTFALYMAKRKFGLNVLAVNYDNGFSETQSLINMKKTCEQLNVDLIIIKSKRNIEKRYVKSAIKASIPFGTFWGISQFCYY